MGVLQIVTMVITLYYYGNDTPAIITIFPISLEQCEHFGESVQFIREFYRADGVNLTCSLKGYTL